MSSDEGLSNEIKAYIQYLIRAIDEGNQDKFDEGLDDWDTVGMLPGQEYSIVMSLISSMEENNASSILRLFVAFMEIIGSGYNYVSVLFSYPLDKASLDFISEVYDLDYFMLIRDLMAFAPFDTNGTLTAIANIKKMFPNVATIPEVTASKLLIIADNLDNKIVSSYLNDVLYETKNPIACRPSWILQSSKTHNELVKELVVETPARWVSNSVEEDASYIVGITEDDRDLDILYRDLVDKFSTMSTKAREDFISTIIWNNQMILLGDRVDIFRVFGMALPRGIPVALEIKSKDPCVLWGSCRSMLCWHNENVDIDSGTLIVNDPVKEDRLDEVWWFTGVCDQCRIRIEKECYAVRMPIETGGFIGCYCSFECLRDIIDVVSLDESVAVSTYTGYEIEPRINVNRLYLINEMEKVYNKYGIWDRS